MRRREFITLLAGTAAWPLAAAAQQPERMRRIGLLVGTEDNADGRARIRGFRHKLRELGWTEGRNVAFDERWGEGDSERIRSLAKELVSLKPDVLLASSVRALAALKNETRAIPIVFVATADPVGQGFVASLAQPGGNVTGFSLFEFSLAGKLLEVLKEMAPRVTRAVLVGNPGNPSFAGYLRAIDAVAQTLGVEVSAMPIHDASEIEGSIEAFARQPNGALLVAPDLTTIMHLRLIVALAARHRLPAIYPFRFFVNAGGLMSYGVDLVDLFARAAVYIDRILKGEKPADLPVQAPSKFEFVINLKTANALGLEIPPALVARADEVIE